jgi:hypothetical protein
MGHYTRFQCDFRLKPDTPAEVIETLLYMTGQGGDAPPPVLPDHPLFSCERWENMLYPHISVFEDGKDPSFSGDEEDRWRLQVSSSFKNYGGEIGHFFNWIAPYVEATPDSPVGESLHEEGRFETGPDLYFVRGGEVVRVYGLPVPDQRGF